jgi:prefoldin subunit 5
LSRKKDDELAAVLGQLDSLLDELQASVGVLTAAVLTTAPAEPGSTTEGAA